MEPALANLCRTFPLKGFRLFIYLEKCVSGVFSMLLPLQDGNVQHWPIIADSSMIGTPLGGTYTHLVKARTYLKLHAKISLFQSRFFFEITHLYIGETWRKCVEEHYWKRLIKVIELFLILWLFIPYSQNPVTLCYICMFRYIPYVYYL